MIEFFGNQMLAAIGDLVEWESIVMHLLALVILTVGLYFLLFKPVKRMIKERQDKIRKIAKEIYGALGVTIAPAAHKELQNITEMGYGHLPVCVAKTQYSLSDDAALLGRPTEFVVNVRTARLAAGAGFVVVETGAIMTMPGLPKVPAAEKIDVDKDGKITGLF